VSEADKAREQAESGQTAASKDPTERQEIRFRRRGGIGEVTLTRPKALNALTLDMIRQFDPYLKAWAGNSAVQAVVVQGAGEKAFCAGGDVRAVWEAGKSGGELTRVFFYEEYTLNRRIHAFPKPYVALIDGITMGGGVGISMHGSHRIAGDRTTVAMPETGIGFFPDVGATWVLPRLAGETGMYLGLTGNRLKTADAVYCGFATHYVPSERIMDLADSLVNATWGDDPGATVDAALKEMAGDPGPAPLAEQRETIDRCFGQDSVENVFRALEREGSDWARETLETLHQRSPTSLKLTFAALRKGAKQDFDDCLKMEYRLSQACMAGHDFYEGIRAVLVEKDHAPNWQPAELAAVSDADIEACFAELGSRELIFED